MKSIVIYYSQTGNTREAGRAICGGIQKETGQCDLIRFQDVTMDMLADYDLIGIGSPIWGSCPTMNVVYFMKELPDSYRGKHFFFYCTHGVTPGRCMIRGVQPMLDRGMTVIGWSDWYGSAKLPRHLHPWFSDGHPDGIDLAEAESFGTAMAVHSRKIRAGDRDLIPELMSPETSDYLYGVGHPFLFPEMDPPPGYGSDADLYPPLKYPTSMAYTMELEHKKGIDLNAMVADGAFDAAKCIGCGRCAEACFCGNIDASTTPPTFRNPHCEHCFFCEGVCPTGAISFDFSMPQEDPQEGLRDYMNVLNRAEAIGRFRRLVKDEEIGWNSKWEDVTGHPRHKEIP